MLPEDDKGGTPDQTDPEVETTEEQGQSKDGDKKEPAETPEEIRARLASAEARIKLLNKESADRRKALEKFEAEDKKRKEAEMSEIDKATTRLSELESSLSQRDAELRTLRIQAAVERAAGKLKFRDPEDAYAMIAPQLAALEIDEQGQVKGVEDALKEGQMHFQRVFLGVSGVAENDLRQIGDLSDRCLVEPNIAERRGECRGFGQR